VLVHANVVSVLAAYAVLLCVRACVVHREGSYSTLQFMELNALVGQWSVWWCFCFWDLHQDRFTI